MVESVPHGSGFITEVPGMGGNAEDPNSQVAIRKDLDDRSADEDAFSQDDDEGDYNLYQVDDAAPPTNYDEPYSTLPAKIKLKSIKVSY